MSILLSSSVHPPEHHRQHRFCRHFDEDILTKLQWNSFSASSSSIMVPGGHAKSIVEEEWECLTSFFSKSPSSPLGLREHARR